MDISERRAQSLVEVMIGIALGAIFVIAVASVIAPALRMTQQVTNVQAQAGIAVELSSNLRAWAAGDWHNVLNLATTSANTYYLIASSSPFIAASGTESVTIGTTTYARYFYVDDLYRDPVGNVTATASGNSYDPSTKKMTIVFGASSSTTSSIVTYVSRNQNNAFAQTNWAAGTGASGPVTIVGSGFAWASSNVTTTNPGGSVTLLQTPVGGGPSSGHFIQGALVSNDTAQTSTSIIFPISNTAGNLIVLAISWDGLATDAPSSITDTRGNPYTLATTTEDGGDVQTLGVYYAQNIAGGTNTVTALWAASHNYTALLAHEYSGVATTNALDAVSGNLQSNSPSGVDAVTSGAKTTVSSSELIFGVTQEAYSYQPTISPGTGYTQRLIAQADNLLSEDRTQSSAGAIAATFTVTPVATTTATIMATFRPRP